MPSVVDPESPQKVDVFPLVSVGLPVYNGMPYLNLALDSLISQDYPNFEVIISDNCSTDETSNICEALAQQHSNVKYYRNSKNIGANRNFERVFHLASGKYFMWAAHDDIWDKSYISECVQVLDAYPSVVITCTDVNFIDSEGNFLQDLSESPYHRNLHTYGLDIVHSIRELISRSCWYSIYGLIRSEAIEKLLPFLNAEVYGADVIWGLRLLFLGHYFRINKRLFFYRFHERQLSGAEIHKSTDKNIKPYTSLFRNLFNCVLESDLSSPLKKQIEDCFIRTLTYENKIISDWIQFENFYILQNCSIFSYSTERFIKTVIIAPILSIHESSDESSTKSSKKQAIVAYPFPIKASNTSFRDGRCLLWVQTLQKLGYEVTLFSSGDATDYQAVAHAFNFNLSLSSESVEMGTMLVSEVVQHDFNQLCNRIQPALVLVGSVVWADLITNVPDSFVSIIDSADLISTYSPLKRLFQSSLDSCKSPFGVEAIPEALITEYSFNDLNEKLDPLQFKVYNRYNFILTINMSYLNFMQTHAPKAKTLILPYILENVRSDRQKINSKYPLLVIDNNEFSYQGYLLFCTQILPRIRSQVPDFEVMLLGNGASNVTVLEGVLFVEGEIDENLYAQGMFVMFPFVDAADQQFRMIEAMSFGLPVILLDSLPDGSLIQDDINGLIAKTIEDFSACVVKLYHDQDLCKELGDAAKQRVLLQHDQSLLINTFKLIENSSTNLDFLVIVDAIFFQLYKTGIARVWCSILEEWAKSGFAQHVLVVNRANTAPIIPGIQYYSAPLYDNSDPASDREMLQQVCDQFGADIFISTYYTTPVSTPSVMMVYDMIPEVFGVDLSQPAWRDKHYSIHYASAFIAISESTARDVVNFVPEVMPSTFHVAHCGVDRSFAPADPWELLQFKLRYGITRPYFLLVGTDSGNPNTHKNTGLFFAAFAKLPIRQAFDIVCTGGGALSTSLRDYVAGSSVHMLTLNDAELRLAYSGAIALIYPSRYEGFGMPIAEAMASGCPVITCPNSSIPEVAGNAAIYVDADDVNALANALCEVLKPDVRELMISAGLNQVNQFSWPRMAQIVKTVLIETTLNLRDQNWLICPDWSCAEDVLTQNLTDVIRAIAQNQNPDRVALLIYLNDFSEEEANLLVSGIAMHLYLEEEISLEAGPEITLFQSLKPLQWQTLANRLDGRIQLEHDLPEAITQKQFQAIRTCYLADLSTPDSTVTLSPPDDPSS